ncbi:MAG: beta-galactosidase, partial [Chloroflexota bacterium]|nr:beta-galactosidase [Chloroflexota bacterium]
MTIQTTETEATDQPWWQQPFRMFQTNLREIDAGLDVERVLDYITDYGANAWLISVGGILSNYPTELDFQTANPHLARRQSGDLIGDAATAAVERGVHLLARMDFSKIDHRRAEEHPEWCFVDAAGEPQVYNGLTSVCPSADYYQHRLFDVLSEVLDRYPVDGFFLNWMSYNEFDYSKQYRGVCHCLSCQRAFAEFAPDATLPAGPESLDYPAWRRFTASKLDDLTARIREHIKARRPEAALILGNRADIVFHEANNAVGRPLWHHRTSEHVSAAKSFRPDVPVLVNSVGFVDMPYRLAGEEPHHFAQYLVQAISRGAIPSTYIMGTPDVIDYECLDTGAEIIQFHRDHADVYRDLVPDARVALVRPDPLRHSAERLAAATVEFQGLYLSLLERHIAFDVLPEDK